MYNIIDFIIRNYKYVLITIVLLAIPLTYFYTKQEINNNIDVFFNKDDPDMKVYNKFKEMYGNEELAIIMFKDDNIFTNEIIEIIREISEMAKAAKGVQRIFSITEQEVAVTINDTLSFRKIIPDGYLGESELKAVRERVLNNKMMRQRLISKEGTTTAIMIELEQTKNSNQKLEMMQKIRNMANKISGSRVRLRFSGLPYFESEMNNLSQKDLMTFTPIITLVIFIIVILMLKNMRLSILCMTDLGITLILSVGLYIACGEAMNLVTIMLPSIILAICVADSIHLLAHYKDEYAINGNDHIKAVSSATKAVWIPCLFTSLTTAAGFFSFITSSLRPPRILGIFTASGVMIACFMTVTFLPAALAFLKKRFENIDSNSPKEQRPSPTIEDKDSLFTRLLLQIGNFSTSYSKTICIVFVFILIFIIIGISKIRYETNVVAYLPDDNVIKTDLKFIEKNLTGVFTIEYTVQAKSQKYDFTNPYSLQLIDEMQNEVMRMYYHVTSTFSLANYFKEINRAFNNNKEEYYKIPKSRLDILDFYEIGDVEVLDKIISPDRMTARISFLGKEMSNEEAQKLINQSDVYLKNKLGQNYSYKYTGMTSLFLSMLENLKDSLMDSFLLAFIIIFFMMLYICKNIKLTLISMIPNLFPIFLTIGLMGLLDIPIDTITVMIASVTLGIAVDDTIHYLVWLRRNVASGIDIKSSILKTYKTVGKPIVITSVILFMGFIILILGSLNSIKTFGLFTAFSIFFALIGDLILFPALILIFKPKIKNI